LLHGRLMGAKAASMSRLPTLAGSAARMPEGSLADIAAPHVLVADGNAETRGVREAQLRAAGFRVSLARTGFEAIVKASCHVPDLILVAESLSDIAASETGRLLTTCPLTSHIPVIRLTKGRRVPQRVLTDLRRVG
jgi:CheY-like chemotaxis protein